MRLSTQGQVRKKGSRHGQEPQPAPLLLAERTCTLFAPMLGYKFVEKPSSAQQAYDYVKSKILSSDYPGGALISENGISAELGMSRTPVRVAFQRLEAEGWLTLYPKRGAVVTPSSPQEGVQVLEARHLIEVHAVSTTAPSVRPSLERELSHLIGLQQQCAESADSSTFATHDAAFHRAIVAACGNAVLVEIYDTLRDRQQRMTVTALGHTAEKFRRILNDHADLARCAVSGDTAHFATTLHQHLAQTHGLGVLQTSPPATFRNPESAGDHA